MYKRLLKKGYFLLWNLQELLVKRLFSFVISVFVFVQRY